MPEITPSKTVRCASRPDAHLDRLAEVDDLSVDVEHPVRRPGRPPPTATKCAFSVRSPSTPSSTSSRTQSRARSRFSSPPTVNTGRRRSSGSVIEALGRGTAASPRSSSAVAPLLLRIAQSPRRRPAGLSRRPCRRHDVGVDLVDVHAHCPPPGRHGRAAGRHAGVAGVVASCGRRELFPWRDVGGEGHLPRRCETGLSRQPLPATVVDTTVVACARARSGMPPRSPGARVEVQPRGGGEPRERPEGEPGPAGRPARQRRLGPRPRRPRCRPPAHGVGRRDAAALRQHEPGRRRGATATPPPAVKPAAPTAEEPAPAEAPAPAETPAPTDAPAFRPPPAARAPPHRCRARRPARPRPCLSAQREPAAPSPTAAETRAPSWTCAPAASPSGLSSPAIAARQVAGSALSRLSSCWRLSPP